MDIKTIVRVVKNQVRLSTRGLDRDGNLAVFLAEIPILVSRRPARRRMGFFQGQGIGDVGRIIINTNTCPTEALFESTLFHELAHAVCHWVHGREADTHGPKWKAIMVQMGQEPTRCHTPKEKP